MTLENYVMLNNRNKISFMNFEYSLAWQSSEINLQKIKGQENKQYMNCISLENGMSAELLRSGLSYLFL